MAWCRPGDKPLSEPMTVRLPTHIAPLIASWLYNGHTSSTQACSYNKRFGTNDQENVVSNYALLLSNFYCRKWIMVTLRERSGVLFKTKCMLTQSDPQSRPR